MELLVSSLSFKSLSFSAFIFFLLKLKFLNLI